MHLNVISLDIPYPPDYGGVIDIYYKLKALHVLGVKIHLHCFEDGREPAEELTEICSTVHYYKSKRGKLLMFKRLPFMVLSRNSATLKENLCKNDFPILMEGLHTTFLLNDKLFAGRKIIVRTHNIEHDYYTNLAKVERNIFQRCFYYSEAVKLKKYEQVLKRAYAILSISPNDVAYFSKHYNNAHYLPAFHGNEKVTATEGKGDFAFYHGHLAVAENDRAALYLVKNVFNDIPYPLVIAGREPSDELVRAVNKKRNITLRNDFSSDDLHAYIQNAQCNILPTFQATGIKLKLFALFVGRFCVVNKAMVENTGLQDLCIVADTSAAMKENIREVFEKKFPTSEIMKRSTILMHYFSDEKNANKLASLLFNGSRPNL